MLILEIGAPTVLLVLATAVFWVLVAIAIVTRWVTGAWAAFVLNQMVNLTFATTGWFMVLILMAYIQN